jgi:hypothetical protein
LSCSGGSVTRHSTSLARVVSRWVREGRPIRGAASRLYRFAGRVIWISTANAYYSISGVGPGTWRPPVRF